jgi:PKD repeat protein
MRYALLAVALVAAGCAADIPTSPATAAPAHGTPSHLEVSAVPGVGQNGGQALITARVQDAYAATLDGITVTFSSDSGTLSAGTVTTDDKGVATTQLRASAGGVKVHASAGPATSDVIVSVQPVAVTPTPNPTPTPTPTPDPTLPFALRLTVFPAAAGSVTHFGLTGTGGVVRATWTTGDGPSFPTTEGNFDYVYAQAGTYRASVTASDATGRTISDTATVVIPAAPIPIPSYTVTLTASPSTVAQGGSSTLSATVTPVNNAPTVTSWAWDCDGNGTIDATTATSATCTYPTAGSYTAAVRVTGGTVVGSATATITVSPPPVPVVSVNCGPATRGTATTCVVAATLSGAATNAITSVTWNFGDNSADVTIASNTATHTYAGAATYPVLVSNVTVTGTTAKGSGSTTAIVQ